MSSGTLSGPPSSAPLMIFRRLLRPTAPLLLSLCPKYPVRLPAQKTPLLFPFTRPHFSSANSRPFSSNSTLQSILQLSNSSEGIEEEADSHGTEQVNIAEPVAVTIESPENRRLHAKLQGLTLKEKKELGSYANSLGKKLKSQQVGKSGVTATVVAALVETLERNELLKLKIHGSCPGELDNVVKQLEEGTGSVVVGRIGRTVILYRPSLSKLEAEEKKRVAQRASPIKKVLKKPAKETGVEARPSHRGHRGSSRFKPRSLGTSLT
ncbi:unnamed protein product [Cuscuta campestris]|uniref:CRM domain-containing protein n=1 Tax=Cuscuta campestris TaxID=132261 RepID=A0A484M2C2_9ASTE|nr:unnamed protein product [Cuscuta campestris]VFQ82954.1 unnamed protein product [Cuscuta campestris]